MDPDVPDSRAASAACSVSGTTIVVRGPVDIATVRWLCERVRLVLGNSDVATIVCDVASCPEPDASTVDALARLRLTARRLGRGFVLGDCSPRLADLLTLLGLADVLLVRPDGALPQPIPRLPAEQGAIHRSRRDRMSGRPAFVPAAPRALRGRRHPSRP